MLGQVFQLWSPGNTLRLSCQMHNNLILKAHKIAGASEQRVAPKLALMCVLLISSSVRQEEDHR
jgi:hypothetical protein